MPDFQKYNPFADPISGHLLFFDNSFSGRSWISLGNCNAGEAAVSSSNDHQVEWMEWTCRPIVQLTNGKNGWWNLFVNGINIAGIAS